MRTEYIRVRTFIEGVYVPKISSIVIQTQNNEQAQAFIELPVVPGFEIEELKRARVHVYWSDIDIRAQRGDSDWPILFEGEITGDESSKSTSNRNFSITCSGYFTYWEQVMLYFYDHSAAAILKAPWTQQISLAVGNQEFKIDAPIAGANVTSTLITTVQRELKEGAEYHSIVKRVFAECLDVNHFFRLQNQRLKLTTRFASSVDKNLDVLVGRDLMLQIIDKDIMSQEGETTMMELLKKVLTGFRYQILHNAQPILVTKTRDVKRTVTQNETDANKIYDNLRAYLTTKKVTPTLTESTIDALEPTSTDVDIEALVIKILTELKSPNDNALHQELTANITLARNELATIDDPEAVTSGLDIKGDDLLAQFLLLPETRFTLPPTCNVIFPQDQTQLGLRRDFLQECTRALGVPVQVAGVPQTLFIAPSSLLQAAIPEREFSSVSPNGNCPPVSQPYHIISHYGYREHPIDKIRKHHAGVDISRPPGTPKDYLKDRPVYAWDTGIVTRARWQVEPKPPATNSTVGYGKHIYIAHGNGTQTRYGHLASIDVLEGQRVERGQKIGVIGTTGASTGLHLHFEIWIGNQTTDPEPLIKGAELAVPGATTPAPTVVVPAKTLETDEAAKKNTDAPWLDYVYLSPEEEQMGIIPHFDRTTIAAYAYMAYAGNTPQINQHYREMLESEFWWQRYNKRTIPTLNLPFAPQLIAGFPALIVDHARPLIALITAVTHTIMVGGGQGVASTNVQLTAPRYWDEGDPFYWKEGPELPGGEEKMEPGTGDFKDRSLPAIDYAHFPSYYLTSLVATNSLAKGAGSLWTSAKIQTPKLQTRPIDKLYADLLGPSVRAIAYQYAKRTTTTTGTDVVYNAAIAGRGGAEAPNTLVGHYYNLLHHDSELAELFVKKYTRRLGASETEIMVTVLGSTTRDGGASYQGPAFRETYQTKIKEFNMRLGVETVFRG
jgi:murein DD-endopeptidase MepM/ murein hydrolase activator NlpD